MFTLSQKTSETQLIETTQKLIAPLHATHAALPLGVPAPSLLTGWRRQILWWSPWWAGILRVCGTKLEVGWGGGGAGCGWVGPVLGTAVGLSHFKGMQHTRQRFDSLVPSPPGKADIAVRVYARCRCRFCFLSCVVHVSVSLSLSLFLWRWGIFCHCVWWACVVVLSLP